MCYALASGRNLYAWIVPISTKIEPISAKFSFRETPLTRRKKRSWPTLANVGQLHQPVLKSLGRRGGRVGSTPTPGTTQT